MVYNYVLDVIAVFVLLIGGLLAEIFFTWVSAKVAYDLGESARGDQGKSFFVAFLVCVFSMLGALCMVAVIYLAMEILHFDATSVARPVALIFVPANLSFVIGSFFAGENCKRKVAIWNIPRIKRN